MADSKISALPASTTPLAGSEVLPIVQGSTTVKVSVANLTAGRAVAMAGGSFTDNITQSTAAKGVNFAANTPAAGMTSQLLDAYEEGTWTPTIGNGSLTVFGAVYTRVGRLVTVQVNIASITDITTAATITISGLPFASKSGTYSTGSMFGRYWNTGSQMLAPYISASSSSIIFYAMTLGANYATVNHNDISNGAIETFITIQYVTS